MTEYRIITQRTTFGDRYLQFKSTKRRISFPQVWQIKEVECWRFVPEKSRYIFGKISERDCARTLISLINDSQYMSCFHGQEDYEIRGLLPFTRKYPEIQKYFDMLNRKHEEYCEKEKRADNAGTTYVKN